MTRHTPPSQLDLLKRPSGRTAIITASGFAIDLAAPDATGLPIEDVARALAYEPRWRGATRQFYSVAEHSVLVSSLVPSRLAYDALFHDVLEFLTGDMSSPMKAHLGRDELKAKLAPIEAALAQWFGYGVDDPAVKRADLIAMATELRDLLPPAWMDWGHLPDPAVEKIAPVGPERAYDLFLARYEEVRHLARRPRAPRLASARRAR